MVKRMAEQLSRMQTATLNRILMLTLINCCFLANCATGSIDFPGKSAEYKSIEAFNGLSGDTGPYLRSLRSVFELASDGRVGAFAYPLTSRSAAMISGRGFRPGKRSGMGTLSFM